MAFGRDWAVTSNTTQIIIVVNTLAGVMSPFIIIKVTIIPVNINGAVK
jgi:hypothetical protein